MAASRKSASAKTVKKKAPAKKPAQRRATLDSAVPAADAVDAQLARYREMRNFSVTAEPSGAKTPEAKTVRKADSPSALPFVIQKHAASHLHYDFRLGWNGVLKSWAVAKGPSYSTRDRRLAVEVEDHPMEYGGFEGIIPKGQYGGGTVMVWDQGTWAPQHGHEDVDDGLRKGSLKFEMFGSKMHGKWTLVRMHSTGGGSGRWRSSTKPNWLLIKEHDEFERGLDDPPVTDEAPNSAVTGRTMEQIAQQEDHVWNSKETARGEAWFRQESPREPAVVEEKARPQTAAPDKQSSGKFSATLKALPREKQPDFVSPQLALEVETPPAENGWLHELKLDGYRIQARKSGKEVALLTRSGLDWTHRVRPIAEAVAALSVDDATLDGEAVVLAENGTTNFADLQAAFQDGAKNPLTYFCFDLLHLNGHNLRGLPLVERKALLAEVLQDAPSEGVVRLSEHLTTGGEEVFRHACELHAEGIVSKRADAPYRAGRGGEWLKAKCLHEQEFVIGGYTLSSDGDDRIGSLLLGYYRDGELIYAGRTGTGFTQKSRKALLAQLKPGLLKAPAFQRVPAEARRGALWVEPKLVAQVRFATWTAEDLVRQAAFLGLREDKAAKEVTREEPTVAPKPKGGGGKHAPAAHQPLKKGRNDPQSRDLEAKGSYGSGQRADPRGPSTSSVAKRAPDSAQDDSSLWKIGASSEDNQSKSHREAAFLPIPKVGAAKLSAPPIRLTHPNKVLDPESGLTKAQLAEYYWNIAERMLPHVADRPLSLVRCPEGAGKPCFYQKHVNHMLPPGVGGIDVPDKKTGKLEPYITLNSAEALAGLAQMGVLEVHPWGSCNDDLEHPDRIIFDLDPDEDLPWAILCEAAADVRARLKKAGLESFLKTTGGKGLHVVVPVIPQLEWPQIKLSAHAFVSRMERSRPSLYLTKMTKAARKGKIYLDYLRNERGATAVAPYSPRARPGAHVSLPLPWTALKLAERPVFAVSEFFAWRSQLRTDSWKNLLTTKQHLDPVRIETSS